MLQKIHINHLLNKLLLVLAASIVMLILAVSSSAVAQEAQPAQQQAGQEQVTPDIQAATCQGAELKFSSAPLTGNECNFEEANPEERLNSLVASVINLFSVVVGIVAVMMIIWGGFKYITSGGDPGNVTGAKNTILYAIVGLVIVALAQFIVKFVLSKAAGTGA